MAPDLLADVASVLGLVVAVFLVLGPALRVSRLLLRDPVARRPLRGVGPSRIARRTLPSLHGLEVRHLL
jgi:hypothetical protein